eukprot:4584623-Amphidinium_carterae.1
MSEVTLTNPHELAKLCRLHLIDLDSKAPRQPYARREVTGHLEAEERYFADDSIDLLRFSLIAHKPRLLAWKRVCRSPLTENDRYPIRTDCIIQGHQTLLAWNNPHSAQSVRGTPNLPLDQSEHRATALAELRAYLRAHAVPLEPYADRLQADLLGDDLYVTGGGGESKQGAAPSNIPTTVIHAVDTFVYAPNVPRSESTLACVQWIVKIELKQTPPYDYLRMVAYSWMRRAVKYQYPVAGLQVTDIAQQFDMNAVDFVEKFWDPDVPKCPTPPVLLVFVLSCVYALDLAVVDEHGIRPDG